MTALHRKHLSKMTAPIIAWLIHHGYVVDECGVLEVTWLGKRHLPEARNTASRETQGHKQVRVP